MELSKIENVVIEGLDWNDYPKFCDAYIAEAEFEGRQLTDLELDALNENSDFVQECIADYVT